MKISDRKAKWPRFFCFLVLFSLVSLLLLEPGKIGAQKIQYTSEKITIGVVENVILLPWGIKMSARIDSGAALSSLDARDIKVRGEWVQFRLSRKFGEIHMRLPLAYFADFKTSTGREERPLVVIEICLGPKRIRALMNLKDRGRLRNPVLIGRNVLMGRFSVDVSKRKTLRPTCAEGP